jgi:DNA-binding transcriptional ArsR family regulator
MEGFHVQASCANSRVLRRLSNIDSAEAAIPRAMACPGQACSLMDGRARTSTELAVIAEVSPSTASVHLSRLKDQELVKVLAQGKHRYYSLDDERVASTLESLMVLAGTRSKPFVPNTPTQLRWARTCYDHMAGEIAVALHARLLKNQWLNKTDRPDGSYDLTPAGARELERASATSWRRRWCGTLAIGHSPQMGPEGSR